MMAGAQNTMEEPNPLQPTKIEDEEKNGRQVNDACGVCKTTQRRLVVLEREEKRLISKLDMITKEVEDLRSQKTETELQISGKEQRIHSLVEENGKLVVQIGQLQSRLEIQQQLNAACESRLKDKEEIRNLEKEKSEMITDQLKQKILALEEVLVENNKERRVEREKINIVVEEQKLKIQVLEEALQKAISSFSQAKDSETGGSAFVDELQLKDQALNVTDVASQDDVDVSVTESNKSSLEKANIVTVLEVDQNLEIHCADADEGSGENQDQGSQKHVSETVSIIIEDQEQGQRNQASVQERSKDMDIMNPKGKRKSLRSSKAVLGTGTKEGFVGGSSEQNANVSESRKRRLEEEISKMFQKQPRIVLTRVSGNQLSSSAVPKSKKRVRFNSECTIKSTSDPTAENDFRTSTAPPRRLSAPIKSFSSALDHNEEDSSTNEVVTSNSNPYALQGSMLFDRDRNGRTVLHEASSKPNNYDQIWNILHQEKFPPIAIAWRDTNLMTARDIAKKLKLESNVRALDLFIIELGLQNDCAALLSIIYLGYDDLHTIRDSSGSSLLDIAHAKKGYENLANLMEKHGGPFWNEVDKIHTCIKKNSAKALNKLLKNMTNPAVLRTLHPKSGMTSFHLAALCQNEKLFEILHKRHPGSSHSWDHLWRIPLCYALALKVEGIISLLDQDGVNWKEEDWRNRYCTWYSKHPESIQALKKKFGNAKA